MEDPEISEVELEELISKSGHDPQALITLLYCNWMTRLFERLADWARRRHGVDGEEVRDYVFDRMHSQTREGARKPWLNNPHRSTWRTCLIKWAYTVAKNRCLSIHNHQEVEERHAASLEHEHTTRIEHGVRFVEPSAHTPSPEESLERKERNGLEEKIHEKAWQVFDSSEEETQRIATLWASGMKLVQIADELGSSTETVRRRLKEYQKAVREEVRKGIAEEIGETKTEACGVVHVLEKIVTNRADFNDLLPTRAPADVTPPSPSVPGTGAEKPRPHGPRTRRRSVPRRRAA
jgi:RNA polymerase sigma factor (sigma-70 family)